jgi:hypothetical protein
MSSQETSLESYKGYEYLPAGFDTTGMVSNEIQHWIQKHRQLHSLEFKSQVGNYFVQCIAQRTEDVVVKRCIRFFQKSAPGLLEDHGAANLWDEICVQFQQDSDWIELCKEHIFKRLEVLVEKLSDEERLSLWLSTYWGECYLEYPEFERFNPEDVPVSSSQIAKHLIDAVCYEAMNYQNKRIRLLTGW